MKQDIINSLSNEEFAAVVAKASCIKDVVRALGYGTVSGANSSTVKKRINKDQIDTSHFKHKAMKYYTDDEVFCTNTTATQSTLRKRFKSRTDIAYVCAICGQPPTWQDKPLTLILDHIDGDNQNGDLANLRWVCPNCNQQLPTTGFHGIKYRDSSSTICKPSAFRSKTAVECSFKKPEFSELISSLFKSNFNFTQTGKLYEVSPNAVQKWLKSYNVPYTRAEFTSWYYLNILHKPFPIKKSIEAAKLTPKAVFQYTKDEEFVGRHASCTAASKAVFGDILHAAHISSNCLGKRKSAYGFIWKYQ